MSNLLSGKSLGVIGAGSGPSAARQAYYVARCRDWGMNLTIFDDANSEIYEASNPRNQLVVCDTSDLNSMRNTVSRYLSDSSLDGVITFVEE